MKPQEALAAALGTRSGWVRAHPDVGMKMAAAILDYPFTPDQRRALAAHFLDAEALAEAFGTVHPDVFPVYGRDLDTATILRALGAKP